VIQDWATPPGKAALAKMGEPQWVRLQGDRYRLVLADKTEADHMCACLSMLRDWARLYLLKHHGTHVFWSFRAAAYVTKHGRNGRGAMPDPSCPPNPDYDQALIVAVLKVKPNGFDSYRAKAAALRAGGA